MNAAKRITDDMDALLFDMDGTLIDSMGLWGEIDVTYLESFGLAVPKDLQSEVEGMGFAETAVYFKKRFHLSDSCEKIMQDWHDMAADFYAKKVELKPGVKPFLKEMKEQGKRMVIATSNARALAQSCMDRLGVNDYLDGVITADEVAGGKPKPDIYLAAAKMANTAPLKCLVFEDVPMGMLSGRRAGMKVCAVEDAFTPLSMEQAVSLADWYITDFRQVLHGTQKTLHNASGERE